MKEEQDYIRDIAEIRSMMERSTKFLSLSGWSGIMAGVYALAGVIIAWKVIGFNPHDPSFLQSPFSPELIKVIITAIIVLILALGTAVILSGREAKKKNEKTWTPTARRLLINLAVPLVAGGFLILIMIAKGLIMLVAPFSLIFYGIAVYNASKFTYEDMKTMGLIEIILGLISAYFTEYGLLFWAAGFGVVHIIYGIYLHYRYEK